ncbi:DciA family protein [Vibrio plantisponsor]|uniref:DciA family protein n=1 Tax=Vibrio plantisponsor TaxID=664643 RepID=A0ABU4IKG5_9VIBR|nr:DciA family protein [Vibrio plantisponsor]MDW6018000.1 DciA family protein [Vibrio plantisponsor]NNM39593.1 DUF721 domain-containing protein [Vibrio plantisponsor]PNH89978.1 DUF721 domain-containing protein [Vibrio diazotrophicus]
MRDHRPTSTDELIESSRLSKLQQHAKEIIQINLILQTLLPKGIEPHIRAANVRGGHLVLEAASASIKMKVDYERLNILNQLRNQGFGKLISIEIKINPAIYRTQKGSIKDQKEAIPRPPLSENAASSLLMVAQNANPKVKQRLENIAKLAKK